MRNLPEMLLLVALLAAVAGSGATSPYFARAGRSVFVSAVVSMMVESWHVGPPPPDGLI